MNQSSGRKVANAIDACWGASTPTCSSLLAPSEEFGCFCRLNQQVLIHCFNSLSYSSFAAIITKRLGSSAGKAAISAIDHHVMFPSIHDAVISAVRSRDFAVRNNFSGS